MFHYSKCPIFLTEKKLERYPPRRNTQKYSIDALNYCFFFRYATLLFKKQRYVSGQHKVNLKIICKENYKYEVQEKSPANQAVTVQQLAEEYWRFVFMRFLHFKTHGPFAGLTNSF